MQSSARVGEYRADVDGLRAIAILSVVAYHVGLPWVSGGFVGVDVFFVISGFLITQILYRELEARGTISISRFYARRARRLLPALVLVVLSVLVAGAFVLPPFGEKASLFESAIASMFFVANEYFRVHSGGYFHDPSALIPLLHLWSLSVEEQFYLVWPLLLVALAGLALRERRIFILVVLGALSGLSFLLCLWLTERGSSFAFFFIGARAWELGLGALLALWQPRRKLSVRQSEILSIVGLSMILVACVKFNASVRFPGGAALLPTLGTAALIYAHSAGTVTPLYRVLSSKPMVLVGRLSYSWYLWHWPLLALARGERLGEHKLWDDMALVAIAFALAWLTFRYIENPMRYGKSARPLPVGMTLRVGAIALVGLSAVSASLLLWFERAPLSLIEQEALQIAGDRSPHQANCAIAPRHWDGSVPVRNCVIGTGAPVVAIWGDSHADSWSPLLDRIVEDSAYAQVTMNACPPLLNMEPFVPGIRGMSNCKTFNTAVMDYLRQASGQGLKGVVITSRWTAYLGKPNISKQDDWLAFYDTSSRSASGALDALRTGLESTLTSLRDTELRALVVFSQPEFPRSIHRCILRQPRENCGIERAVYENSRANVKRVIGEVTAAFENVRVIDPAEHFCDDNYCGAYVAGAAVSWDEDHISASSARSFAVIIENDLCWLRHRELGECAQQSLRGYDDLTVTLD